METCENVSIMGHVPEHLHRCDLLMWNCLVLIAGSRHKEHTEMQIWIKYNIEITEFTCLLASWFMRLRNCKRRSIRSTSHLLVFCTTCSAGRGGEPRSVAGFKISVSGYVVTRHSLEYLFCAIGYLFANFVKKMSPKQDPNVRLLVLLLNKIFWHPPNTI